MIGPPGRMGRPGKNVRNACFILSDIILTFLPLPLTPILLSFFSLVQGTPGTPGQNGTDGTPGTPGQKGEGGEKVRACLLSSCLCCGLGL